MNNTETTNIAVNAPVSSDLNVKVSDAEAQRKTAIMIEGMLAFFYCLVGLPLVILGAILLANNGGWGDSGMSSLNVNSYFAMIIVGAFLVVWAIVSTIFTMEMQMKNKTEHKISNTLGGLTFITLNPASFGMVRRSNGWLSRKEKKKLAKKNAIANSTDSIDVKADVAEEQQASVEQA